MSYFAEGDYCIRRVEPTYLWRVWRVETVESVMKENPNLVVAPIGDRLTLAPICTLEGEGVPDCTIKQQGWDVDYEPPPPLLLMALMAQHGISNSG